MDHNSPSKFLLCVVFGVYINFWLTSCMDPTLPPAGQSLAACDNWEAGIENIYENPKYSSIMGDLEKIYRDQDQNLKRDTAFKILVNQVDKWSDAHTIKTKDGALVRVTIVFISPDLAKTVILNDFLQNPGVVLGADDSTDEFKSSISTLMAQIVERREYFFLVIVTTSASCNGDALTDGCIVTMPIGKLTAYDANDDQMTPQHDDHYLEREILLVDGWKSGWVGYSIGAKNGNSCNKWFLDPKFNTTITLGMPNFIESDSIKELTFGFPYRSLLLNNRSWIPADISLTPESRILRDKTAGIVPPLPTRKDFRNESVEYKAQLARFVWHKLFEGLILGAGSSTTPTNDQAEVKISP